MEKKGNKQTEKSTFLDGPCPFHVCFMTTPTATALPTGEPCLQMFNKEKKMHEIVTECNEAWKILFVANHKPARAVVNFVNDTSEEEEYVAIEPMSCTEARTASVDQRKPGSTQALQSCTVHDHCDCRMTFQSSLLGVSQCHRNQCQQIQQAPPPAQGRTFH